MWSIVVALTGGFIVHLGPVRLSSRNPRNGVLIALLSLLFVAAVPVGRNLLREQWASWNRWRLAAVPVGRNLLREQWSSWLRWRLAAVAAVEGRVRWLWPICAAVPVLVALVGIGLDIHQWANALPMWLDEEMIALNLRDRSLAALAGPLWLGQAAPFGWLALQRAIVLTLGTGERALRLVPVLFGMATVTAALWIGRRWMGWIGAAALVLLCSISQQLSHFSFEVKHYSADGFWALLLPALAVWAIEAHASNERTRRTRIWWVAAAVGHWFANGALLVTPGCVVILLAIVWRRDGRRAAVTFALGAVIWLVSFAVHYQLSLGATHNSTYLREYWTSALPPASAGLAGTAQWLMNRLKPLASDPAGTSFWVSLWLSAVCGFALSFSPALGAMFATVPISAFALAGLGIVPLHERFSLWIVPALYVGVALLIDRLMRLGREASPLPQRPWPRLVVAVLVLSVLFVEYALCADIYRRGRRDLEIPSPGHKHYLDDRAAVRWLMRHRQPGDAVMTTRQGWPAVWWYGQIHVPDENGVGSRMPDGGALYEMVHLPAGSDCQHELLHLRKDHHRVLVYLGFRDVPEGFDDLLVRSLDQLGAVTAVAEFAYLGRALVVEIGAPASRNVIEPSRRTAGEQTRLGGCVGVQPARRW